MYKILETLDMSKMEDASLEYFEEDLRTNTNMYWNSKFGERMKQIPVINWICTDTQVGLYVFLFDNEFVAIGWQPYRKANMIFEWRNHESAMKVRQFIFDINFEEEEEPSFSIFEGDPSDKWILQASRALKENNDIIESLYKSGVYKRPKP